MGQGLAPMFPLWVALPGILVALVLLWTIAPRPGTGWVQALGARWPGARLSKTGDALTMGSRESGASRR
jgi:hypothetical protein